MIVINTFFKDFTKKSTIQTSNLAIMNVYFLDKLILKEIKYVLDTGRINFDEIKLKRDNICPRIFRNWKCKIPS